MKHPIKPMIFACFLSFMAVAYCGKSDDEPNKVAPTRAILQLDSIK